MTIQPHTTVADIAIALPRSIAVFERYGIDYCCGGKSRLDEACAKKKIAIEEIREQIEAVAHGGSDADVDWAAAPPSHLIGHIVDRYHGDLRRDLPQIEALLEKVERAHADRHAATLAPLHATFRELRGEVEPHMEKEERVLFPHIQSLEDVAEGRRPPRSVHLGLAQAATHAMRHEHDVVGSALLSMRELTNGYAPPADACVSFRALYAALARFEEELHRHIHLENNVLFPRAVRMEDEMA